MRYTVHPSDDGRYFILDTTFNLVILWVGNKSVAETACDHFNRDYEANLAKSS